MLRFRITLAYDGTEFVGWQRQAEGVSIQGLLEDALGDIDGGAVTVTGAGRTDAGVHALEQVASFSLARDMEVAAVVGALNARLPHAVRVLSAEHAAPDFHPRFDARAKTYRYRLWNVPVSSPFEYRYTWHITAPLDVAAMHEAAIVLCGRHDFGAFQSAGSDVQTAERTVFDAGVQAAGGPLIVFEISADGFLRHMVRAIAGTLVDVGRGRLPPAAMREILEARERARAGRTAPASGLFLVRVNYDAALAP